MSKESLRDRIGVDLGNKRPVEEGVEWALANDVRYIDVKINDQPNHIRSFDEARCKPIREKCEKHGIRLGVHTESAINVAETTPILAEASDEYLRAFIDIEKRLHAERLVVHAGYHFGDFEPRRQAGLERLQRAVDYAEKQGVQLLLESMNKEPEDAEVHYLGHNVEECKWYFDRLQSPHLAWSFTINHAHLVPEGIDGFLDTLDFSRCKEVRVADCFRNGIEVHLKPGEGNLPFGPVLKRIEGMGYTGHYTNAFGTWDDRLAGREYMVKAFESA
jgi:sugar phosphate isomerase/epimerase